MLTAKSDNAGTSSATGSLIAIDRAGTVVNDRLRKVRVLSEPGSMFAPSVRLAMCAPPIAKGSSPKVLEILIRTAFPPALVCTITRRV
jgi:hypothetical protein